jgi:hypothetical protein
MESLEIKLSDAIEQTFNLSQELFELENYDPYNQITLQNKTNPLESWTIQLTQSQGNVTFLETGKTFKNEEVVIYTVKRPDIYRRHKFIHDGKVNILRIYEDGTKEVMSSERWLPVCEFAGCCFSTKLYRQMCATHRKGNTELKKPAILIPKKEKEEMVNVATLSDNGSVIEEYVVNILKSFKNVVNINWVAGTNSTFDILYKLENETEFRGLQVKKLSESTYKDNYNITQKKTSFDELLYVCINEEQTRFVLIKGKFVGKRGLTFSFYSEKTKYDEHMYRDYNKFTKDFQNQVSTSMIVTDKIFKNCFTAMQLSEYESIERFQTVCKEKNIIVERCSLAQKKYDIIVNGKFVQCKFTTRKSHNQIRFHLSKSNGQSIEIPYDESDEIDFVMAESGYDKGNFYIIPKNILVDKEYFSSENSVGRTNLDVLDKSNADITKYHWSNHYYNAFNLLE